MYNLPLNFRPFFFFFVKITNYTKSTVLLGTLGTFDADKGHSSKLRRNMTKTDVNTLSATR